MSITRRSAPTFTVDHDARPATTARSRRRGRVLLACLGIYIVTYAILSMRGSYVGHNLGGSDNRDTWF